MSCSIGQMMMAVLIACWYVGLCLRLMKLPLIAGNPALSYEPQIIHKRDGDMVITKRIIAITSKNRSLTWFDSRLKPTMGLRFRENKEKVIQPSSTSTQTVITYNLRCRIDCQRRYPIYWQPEGKERPSKPPPRKVLIVKEKLLSKFSPSSGRCRRTTIHPALKLS